MAKTYKSDFKITQLDKVTGDILSQFVLKSGVGTVASVDSLKAMGIKSIPGFDVFTDAQSQGALESFVADFSKRGYVAVSALGKAMAKYDPHKLGVEGAKRADDESLTDEERLEHIKALSINAQNADVAVNALGSVYIEEKSRGFLKGKEDFRCYEDLTAGMGRFVEKYKKAPDSFTPQEIWSVVAGAAYAKEVHDANIDRFNALKLFQSKVGGTSVDQTKANGAAVSMLTSVGVKLSDVESVLSGHNVPNTVLIENSQGFADDASSFDVRDKDLGRITLSGIKTYGRVADQLASLVLKGVLVDQLNLQGAGYPIGLDSTGTRMQFETLTSYKLSALPEAQQKELLAIVKSGNETDLSQVEQRLQIVTDIIKFTAEQTMANLLDGAGNLKLDELSPKVQRYLEGKDTDGNALFATEQAKIDYIRETIQLRSLEAVISSGSANLPNSAEILGRMAEQSSRSANENFYIPAYHEEDLYDEEGNLVASAGDPILDDRGVQQFTKATLFNEEKSQYILYHQGQTLLYDGPKPDFENDNEAFDKVLLSLHDKYGVPKLDAEGKPLPPYIDNLDLAGAKIEDFRESDMISKICSIQSQAAKCVEQTEQKDMFSQQPIDTTIAAPQPPKNEEDNEEKKGKSKVDGPVLFRSLPLYQQYVAEFRNMLEKSGLKITFPNKHEFSHAPAGKDPNSEDPPTAPVKPPKAPYEAPNVEVVTMPVSPIQVPPQKNEEEERIELKGRVEAASKDDPSTSKYAKLKNDLQEEFGIDARFIGTNVMLGLLSEINSWKGVPVRDCIAKFKGEFEKACEDLGKTDLRAKSEYLSSFAAGKYGGIHGNEAAVATVKRCEGFTKDYVDAYLQEEVDEEIANLGEEFSNAGQERQQEIREDLKNSAGLALTREGLKFAVSEELANYMANQEQSASEIQPVKLPEIIPAQGAAPVEPEVAPVQ